MRQPRIVGLGGSLKEPSSSLSALEAALAACREAGAETEILRIGSLDLPLYAPGIEPTADAVRLAESAAAADGLIWSSPLYHGSISGSFKNAVDWLQLIADRDPPYLSGKPIGLIATAGGVQGLQAVNTMDFVVRALRGWSVPLVIPVARASQAFARDGTITDPAVAEQLRSLGVEVVRAARQLADRGSCDYAQHRSGADSLDI